MGFPSRSKDTLLGKAVLGKFLGKTNRSSEGAAFMQSAIAGGMKVLGAHNPVMIEWQEMLAQFLKEEGRYNEAAGAEGFWKCMDMG